MRYGWVLFLFLVLLSACGSSATDTAAVERVKSFVAATEARDVDAMIAMIAPEDRRDAGWQLRQAMPQVLEIQYRSPQYSLESSSATSASVLMQGSLFARTVDGQELEQPLSQVLELVKQDNTWYITGNGVKPPVTP